MMKLTKDFKDNYTILIFILLIGLCVQSLCAQRFEHPRGIIQKTDVEILRAKVKHEPYSNMLQGITYQYQKLHSEGKWKKSNKGWAYPAADLALVSAQLYLLTGENKWAQTSKEIVDQIINDKETFLDPSYFGLTRAQSLLKVMMAYDFCYEAWGDTYAEIFTQKIYPIVFSMSASMGRSANYDMASNWMGVRYGTVLFTSLIWDDFENGNEISKSSIAHLEFNAKKRIEDFALANIHEDGWNVESLGYWAYGWSFVHPALIAWTSKYDLGVERFSLNDRMVKAFQAAIVSFIPIKNLSTYGIKPDFSDDSTTWSSRWLPYGYHLAQGESKQYLRSALDLYNKQKDWTSVSDGAFENIVFSSSDDVRLDIPKTWKYFFSPGQGVAVTRNQFKDENDILVAFSTTSHRRGHQGGDNLSFRVIGLNNIWVVGAGRTNLTAGQSSFFPSKPDPDSTRYEPELGTVNTQYYNNGESFISAAGNATGVDAHRRSMKVNMTEDSATILVTDSSENGSIWRINTPEFNKVNILNDGFEIIGPNETKLIAKILTPFDKIETGVNRYGGNKQRHNYGILYNGERYENTIYIDVHCDRNIEVKLELFKP